MLYLLYKLTKQVDCMALLDYIKSENLKADLWMKENPGSWRSKMPEDLNWWAAQGITTVEQLQDAMQAEHEHTMAKEQRRNYARN